MDPNSPPMPQPPLAVGEVPALPSPAEAGTDEGSGGGGGRGGAGGGSSRRRHRHRPRRIASPRTPNVYIRGVNASITTSTLSRLCSEYGTVRSVAPIRLVRGTDVLYTFVLMDTVEEAQRLMISLPLRAELGVPGIPARIRESTNLPNGGSASSTAGRPAQATTTRDDDHQPLMPPLPAGAVLPNERNEPVVLPPDVELPQRPPPLA